ncbi:hypothetical protein CVT24_003860 [Panaeolus cyanescens]|uniref:NAD-dependent protein deacylase n=1 Tax=Panaeolus cyanescens TaxID=181874 RepID=A0A409W883_9AGAR|nr:hypothetical protein CVT24_003860 [Panaeolus cyanescens]
MPSKDINAFRNVLRKSKNIIAVAGAGLSAASGIPTFRGAGGMWRKYDAISLATPEAFQENPSIVWQFYHYRREVARRANPNDAHRTLSALSLDSIRHQIAPESKFTLITQNVDGLSIRSNEQFAQAMGVVDPKFDIYEMHGTLFDVLCTNKECRHREHNTNSPVCEALGGTEEFVEKGIIDPIISEDRLPKCSVCGSLARPGVVWFGEIPHKLEEIDKIVAEADLCLVIGTSSVVYPAAGYAAEVLDNGGDVAVFNLERSAGDGAATFRFIAPCEVMLPKALGLQVEADGRVSVAPQDG